MARQSTNVRPLEVVQESPSELEVLEELQLPPEKDGCPPCEVCEMPPNAWLWIAGAALAGYWLRGRIS